MRRPSLLRSASVAFAATAFSVSTLVACTSPTPPDDSANARSSSTTTAGGQSSNVPPVIIALRAAVDGPFHSANGKAKFKSEGGERELEVEVEDVRAGLEL